MTEQYRTEVKAKDLKVGEYWMESSLFVSRAVNIDHVSNSCMSVHCADTDYWLSTKRCTFYRVEPEPETPYIELGSQAVNEHRAVAFWIKEQREKIASPFTKGGVTIAPPDGYGYPLWYAGQHILRIRGHVTSRDHETMIATPEGFADIQAAVSAFNMHYEGLAAEKKRARTASAFGVGMVIQSAEPRKITDDFGLGSDTTATHCLNCSGENVSAGGNPTHLCDRFYQTRSWSSPSGSVRLNICLAAEKRSNATKEGAG